MKSALSLLTGLLALGACDQGAFPRLDWERPYDLPPRQESSLQPREAPILPQTDETMQRIAARIVELRARFAQEFHPPETRRELTCPSPLPAVAAADTPVVVRIVDDRYEPKTLLPLELRTRLQSDEFAPLAEYFVGDRTALVNLETAALSSPQAAPLVEKRLDEVAARRLIAVLHVVSYSKPHVFRRKGKLRPEWAAGALGGRLVVYDLRTGSPQCQAWLQARGNADGAPLRRRLREMTRARLHTELLQETQRQMAETLRHLSPMLSLPSEPAHSNSPSAS